ncbi:putative toxin [Pelagerythrobacter marensis]|uniref:Tox-REase-7 domain-containing protein n=1 Tax=Pelagerythrobacter marensis TaxID=543877 RepID=A0A0G3X8R4_9SPHN|nr:putative toxin [Pelagerythrobacter marensis]AKM07955.1 hypothetical protein AM2010_1893 [Pelagerythrobacter marensis]
MGEIGTDGSDNVDFATAIARRDDTGNGSFRGGATTGQTHADFDLNHRTLAATSQVNGSGYVARGGESLQQVAAAVWGDASLWYKLAEANSLGAGAILGAGQSLRIPAGVQVNTHNADTVRPYDPSAALGDISPTTPQPKKQKGDDCGVVGAVLLTVVAVAVTTIATVGAAAAISGKAFGTVLGAMTGGATASGVGAGAWMAGGAIGGAAGSIASQGVGVATGLQDRFNWKGVGLAALSGGIGGGLGPNFGAGWQGAAVRGAVGNALTQGVGVATGLQSKFDFAGVAAAGVGAATGRAIAGRVGTGFGASLATHTAGGIADAATRSALNGESFGRNLTTAIPDIVGQAVGGTIGKALLPRPGNAPPVEVRLASAADAPAGSVPNGPYRLENGADYTPEEMRGFAQEWRRLRGDERYQETEAAYWASYWDRQAQAVLAGRGGMQVAATDPGRLDDIATTTIDIGTLAIAGLRDGLAWLSDASLAEIAEFRTDYAVSSASYKEAYSYDPLVYGRDIGVGFLTSAASALASVPGMLAHPIDRGLAPIARGLDSVFLDNRSAMQVVSDTRMALGRASSTQIALGTGDVAFGVASIATPARGAALARAGSYRSPWIDAFEVRAASMAEVRSLGIAGERAVGDIGQKVRLNVPGTDRYRVVDGFDDLLNTISEVKNVKSLSYTQQLRDNVTIARSQGARFDLYLRSNTRVTGPLEAAFQRGEIVPRYIPGT